MKSAGNLPGAVAYRINVPLARFLSPRPWLMLRKRRL
jgi:hypothetical protein